MPHNSRSSLPRPLKVLAAVYILPIAILGVLLAGVLVFSVLAFLIAVATRLLGG